MNATDNSLHDSGLVRFQRGASARRAANATAARISAPERGFETLAITTDACAVIEPQPAKRRSDRVVCARSLAVQHDGRLTCDLGTLTIFESAIEGRCAPPTSSAPKPSRRRCGFPLNNNVILYRPCSR